MTKITYQNVGSNWIVFINGDSKTEIEQRYFSLWNWKATSGELDWLDDYCAKIWTTKEDMLRYFRNISLNELIDTRVAEFKGKKGGAFAVAKEMAQEKLSQMEKTNSRMIFGSEPEHDYSLGSICAEKPDLDLKDYFINKSFAV